MDSQCYYSTQACTRMEEDNTRNLIKQLGVKHMAIMAEIHLISKTCDTIDNFHMTIVSDPKLFSLVQT